MSYQETRWRRGFCPFAKMQSMYLQSENTPSTSFDSVGRLHVQQLFSFSSKVKIHVQIFHLSLLSLCGLLSWQDVFDDKSWKDKGVHTFPKGICPKVNIISRLKYELAYYGSAVHRFNHYTTRTPSDLPFDLWFLRSFSKSLVSVPKFPGTIGITVIFIFPYYDINFFICFAFFIMKRNSVSLFKIQFLYGGILFLAMFWWATLQFPYYVAWSIHTVIFLPIFVFRL